MTDDLLSKYRGGSKKPSPKAQVPPPVQTHSAEDLAGADFSNEEPVTKEAEEVIFSDSSMDLEILDAYWGNFKKLAGTPKEGSVLFVFKSHKIGFKEMKKYFEEVYLKRLGPALLDPEVELHTYILYSLVLPHTAALEVAEHAVDWKKNNETSNVWPLISDMTGYEMKDRGDMVNLIRAVLRRYPKILDFFVPRMNKVKSS